MNRVTATLEELSEEYNVLMTELAMRARHMSETQQEINDLVKEMADIEAEMEFIESGGKLN